MLRRRIAKVAMSDVGIMSVALMGLAVCVPIIRCCSRDAGKMASMTRNVQDKQAEWFNRIRFGRFRLREQAECAFVLMTTHQMLESLGPERSISIALYGRRKGKSRLRDLRRRHGMAKVGDSPRGK